MKIPIAFSPITSPTTIKLASGQPFPTAHKGHGYRDRIRHALLSLKPGEQLGWYLDYHEQGLRAARQLGIVVQTMKIDQKGIACWRVR